MGVILEVVRIDADRMAGDWERMLVDFGKANPIEKARQQPDKGQQACAVALVDAIAYGSPAPIAFDESMEVSRISIELAGGMRAGADSEAIES